MVTPVTTIADALIAFILSLLRDPAAAEQFDAAPTQTLASNGLEGACLADVRAVKPVIVDHPSVTPKPPGPPPPRLPDRRSRRTRSCARSTASSTSSRPSTTGRPSSTSR